ncbi:LamG domain-containing protein [Curtobacterium flaccumfaciens]|nr:LamG domain-containing protein [Curtobacterium flaccumfaciens]
MTRAPGTPRCTSRPTTAGWRRTPRRQHPRSSRSRCGSAPTAPVAGSSDSARARTRPLPTRTDTCTSEPPDSSCTGCRDLQNGFRFATGSTARVDDGQWHHAVGTLRVGRAELWLDGALVGTRTDVRGAHQYDGHWRVGRESLSPWPGQPADYTFRGDVDSVRVYDRVLDGESIAAHHRAGR